MNTKREKDNKETKDKTIWCTPEVNLEDKIDYWKDFRKRKEISLEVGDNDSIKRKVKEKNVEEKGEEVFAKSQKTPRSPMQSKEKNTSEGEINDLNMNLMTNMILEKQKELIKMD